MAWEELWRAGPVISGHALAAFAALFLGAAQLLGKKGTPTHRALGYVWVALMAVVALSSFFIHQIKMVGLFSPIHLLSIFTLFSLSWAVYEARRGEIARHRLIMISLFFLALVLTGGFTLLPGRIMHSVFFG